jgi:hypothetical protein
VIPGPLEPAAVAGTPVVIGAITGLVEFAGFRLGDSIGTSPVVGLTAILAPRSFRTEAERRNGTRPVEWVTRPFLLSQSTASDE